MNFAIEQFYKLFQGALLAQGLFLVVLYLMVKKRDIAYYSIYLLLLAFYFFWNAPNTFFNLNDQEIFNSAYYVYVNTPLIIITHLAYIYFLKHFFNGVFQSNRLIQGIKFFTLLAPILIIISIAAIYFQKSNQLIFYLVNFFSTGISIYMLFFIYRRKTKGVRLVVAGMLFNMVGNALTILMIVLWRANIHHILTDSYPLFFMRCGILADIFLYMIAILQKLSLHEKQLAVQKLASELAVEKLKNQISKELHDDIGSTLSGINMYSHLAKQQAEQGNKQDAHKTLEVIQHAADEMIYKLKDMIWAMQPNSENIAQLSDKIREYAIFITGAKNIDLQTNFSDEMSNRWIPAAKKHHIYNIAKEALNNSVKYSKATHITIEASANQGMFTLCIIDNGSGFNKLHVLEGNGLANMEKRAAEMGSLLQINSTPEKGTIIFLEVEISSNLYQ